jgi:asparagine synthetase B (glutamine-hydrolysing)
MCGIALTLLHRAETGNAPIEAASGATVQDAPSASAASTPDHQWASITERTLLRRGPDSQRSHIRQLRQARAAQAEEQKRETSASGSLSVESSTLTAILTGTVLHLRGTSSEVTVQPLVDESSSNALCWNGEVYSIDYASLACGGEFPIAIPPLRPDQNDTAYVLSLLCALPPEGFASAITRLMHAIDGPFCFIFLHAATNTVWYGRDKLGRRSLVATRRPSVDGVEILHVSSLILRFDEQDQQLWEEVATTGLWCFDTTLSSSKLSSSPFILRHSPYPHIAHPAADLELSQLPLAVSISCGVDSAVPPYTRKVENSVESVARLEAAAAKLEQLPPAVAELPAACRLLYSALHASMSKRIGLLCTPASPFHARVGILFSGGIDCMVLALFAHKLLPPGEPLDLINVAFCGELKAAAVNRLVPDRITSINGWRELRRCAQADACAAEPSTATSQPRRFNLIHVNVTLRMLEQNRAHIVSLLEPNSTVMDFNIASVLWFGTMGKGILYQDPLGDQVAADESEVIQSRLSRLGVEADASPSPQVEGGGKKKRDKGRTVPPEILAQLVAAKQARLAAAASSNGSSSVAAPSPSPSPDSGSDSDREQLSASTSAEAGSRDTKSDRRAQKALERKLVRAYFKKQDRKAHDEEQEEILPTREDFEDPDSDPCNDISYEQRTPSASAPSSSSTPSSLSTSHAKILLIGIGADEQLAGYGRHRTVWTRSGPSGLASELAKDFDRIWRRNLGRDDRIVSDSGREARHPFLDEQLVELLHSMPLTEVCDFSKPPGVGDKRILRQVARALGLTTSSQLVKRAMQFGSRIANKKVAGYVPMSSSIVLREIVNPYFLRSAAQAAGRIGGGLQDRQQPAYDTAAPSRQLDKRVQKAAGKPGFV